MKGIHDLQNCPKRIRKGSFSEVSSIYSLLPTNLMYNEEETLRIQLPSWSINTASFSKFTDESTKKHIKTLIIVQEKYHGYHRCLDINAVLRIPDTIGNLTELESISITAWIETLPNSLCTLQKLRILDLSGCYNILSIPSEVLAMPTLKIKIGHVISPASAVLVITVPQKGISNDTFAVLSGGNKANISQLIIHQERQTFDSPADGREEVVIPDDICNTEEIKCISLRGNVLNIPTWIFKQKSLHSLGLSGHFDSLPELLGGMRDLSSLDLTGCSHLVSLPESIGNLQELTSLTLTDCPRLVMLPTTLHRIPHLTTPLPLANVLTLASDLDWSQFPKYVTVPLYLNYLMRTNKLASLFPSALDYLRRFNPLAVCFKEYQISNVYGLIKGRREGGGDLTKQFCLMLTNDGVKRGSRYVNRLQEWTSEEKKRDGMECLKILFMNVYGLEMKQAYPHPISTARRIREVWKDEGKDEEGRREWEKRWREGEDIMNEEDVMETSIMHLCIPDQTKKKNGLIIPSVCSFNALSVLLNERSDEKSPYHFPVFDINDQQLNAVIIRNLPSGFDYQYSSFGDELKSLIMSICPIVSVVQAINLRRRMWPPRRYGIVRVGVNNPDDAKIVQERIDGCTLYGRRLSVSVRVEKRGKEGEEE